MTEQLSAWMDGELGARNASLLPPQLTRDIDFRANWDCYQTIGDTLRGMSGPDLCARICARLDAEPTVLVPQRRQMAQKLGRLASPAGAGAAAVVIVAFVGWIAWPSPQQNSPQIAAISATEVIQAAVPAGEDARDYLLAHQPYSPSTALQGLAVYIRAISQEMPLRTIPVIR